MRYFVKDAQTFFDVEKHEGQTNLCLKSESTSLMGYLALICGSQTNDSRYPCELARFFTTIVYSKFFDCQNIVQNC